MKTIFPVVSAVVLLATVASGCTFEFDPAAIPHYYRSEGWLVPQDQRPPSALLPWKGFPPVGDVPGADVYVVPHDDPYIVEFPAQVFTFNGTSQKMQPVTAKAQMVRIEMHGRVVAYSFSLVPVSVGIGEGGKVVYSMAACIFYATFVDDKGDGVFRLLIPAPFSARMVPRWAKRSKG